jgi:hypothetical protein
MNNENLSHAERLLSLAECAKKDPSLLPNHKNCNVPRDIKQVIASNNALSDLLEVERDEENVDLYNSLKEENEKLEEALLVYA